MYPLFAYLLLSLLLIILPVSIGAYGIFAAGKHLYHHFHSDDNASDSNYMHHYTNPTNCYYGADDRDENDLNDEEREPYENCDEEEDDDRYDNGCGGEFDNDYDDNNDQDDGNDYDYDDCCDDDDD